MNENIPCVNHVLGFVLLTQEGNLAISSRPGPGPASGDCLPCLLENLATFAESTDHRQATPPQWETGRGDRQAYIVASEIQGSSGREPPRVH